MRSDAALLLDMVLALRKIVRFARGLDEQTFRSNDLVQSAVMREFQVLGEAARLITDKMLTASIRAALNRATYELLGNGEGYYCEIPGLQGVWANEDTLEACRNELPASVDKSLYQDLRRAGHKVRSPIQLEADISQRDHAENHATRQFLARSAGLPSAAWSNPDSKLLVASSQRV